MKIEYVITNDQGVDKYMTLESDSFMIAEDNNILDIRFFKKNEIDVTEIKLDLKNIKAVALGVRLPQYNNRDQRQLFDQQDMLKEHT